MLQLGMKLDFFCLCSILSCRKRCLKRILLLSVIIYVYLMLYWYQTLDKLLPLSDYAQMMRLTANREPEPPQIWPQNNSNGEDRILSQLKYAGVYKDQWLKPLNATVDHLKIIELYRVNAFIRDKKLGRERFLVDKCDINTCYVVDAKRNKGLRADAVIYTSGPIPDVNTTSRALHIYYQLESPKNTKIDKKYYDWFNWTATYRRSSELVTPYEKFVLNDNISITHNVKPSKNYAKGRSKMVSWFVSHCGTKNGRDKYAKELGNYVAVDVYGKCGTLKCSRRNASACNIMLKKEYKFYLAFENSNCRDYITEKLFWNGYDNDVVPIVMGAHPDDYRHVAPPHSYIHVDDFASPKELAAYLHILDKNDTLYNEYFKWKGTGTFINTKFWCRLCAMLHARDKDNYVHWYPNIHQWWFGEDVCVQPNSKVGWSSWRPQIEDKVPNLPVSNHSLSDNIKKIDNEKPALKL